MKQLILITVFSILGGISITAQSSLNDALVAYYPFCGNLEDMSGNGNHGVAHGGYLSDDFNNLPNSAYSFDGIDDMIKIADADQLYLDGDFTISAWVNPTKRKSQIIIRKGPAVNGAFSTLYSLSLSQTNAVVFGMFNGTELRQARYNNGYNLNTWSLVTGVYKDGFMYLYVNAILVATQELGGAVPDDTYPLLIGTRLQLPSSTFEGRIDEVRIWDRSLHESEIGELYTMDYNTLPSHSIIDTALCGDEIIEIYDLQITESGIYTVTIPSAYSCAERNIEIHVSKNENTLVEDILLDCSNKLHFDRKNYEIHWDDDQCGSRYTYAVTGWHLYTLKFDNDCSISDSIYLEFTDEVPTDFLVEDIVTCESEITISSPFPNTTWSTGQTGTEIVIDESMTVHASYLTEYGCLIEDDIDVVFDRPMEGFLGDDVVYCALRRTLKSPYPNTVWPDGSVGSEYEVSTSDEIEAIAIGEFGCERRDIMSVELIAPVEVTVPNFISKSNVSNGCFNIKSNNINAIDNLTLYIYDLSGRKVFQTKEIDFCWNILNVADGMYVYNLEIQSSFCNDNELLSGKIMIFE